MGEKNDIGKEEVKKKTLDAKNTAEDLKEKTSKKHAENVKDEIKSNILNKSSEIKENALEKESDLKDKALEVKKGALKKTADSKEIALMKTSEIKENAHEKSSEIMADTADKAAELRENAEKTRKQAERKINEFINTLKDKQEEFGKTLADYTSQKPLTDIIETDKSYIIKVDLPRIKKENINVNITEDSIEIQAKFDEEDENLEFIKKERSYGDTSRLIPLPEKIEVKKATAKFKDAVLTVELPKVQEEKIKVKIE